MSNSFTIHLSLFTMRYPFTIHHAGVVLHGKRFTVNVWKTENGEQLTTCGDLV